MAASIWDNLLSHYDLLLAVLDHCGPASLYNVAKTCRAYHATICSQSQLIWDINRHLLRYFSDPVAFRSLQARTATLISGSSALQFLDRTFYRGSDLNLYVYEDHAVEVCEWIMQDDYIYLLRPCQGPNIHAVMNAWPQPHLTWFGVREFIDLKRRSDGQRIQVVIACTSPMEIVLSFNSTCLLNIISADKAYSLYPTATFKHRRSLTCSRLWLGLQPRPLKCQERGWAVLNTLPKAEQQAVHSSFGAGRRSIDDRLTWVLPLGMTDISLRRAGVPSMKPLLEDPVRMTAWVVEYDRWNRAHLTCKGLKSAGLRYRCVAGTPLDAQFFVDCGKRCRAAIDRAGVALVPYSPA
ncbi:hypothetical protein GLOTRDRAFT_94274 [Gloeophyllum trabeum ATCC 11539]|uniref:F-box domain-containing protein n=1 Tax=Gloeophyllum trabeum (strain ATCC 11539 / FP-39264 / Madison 617) TaxID=670483 RepID=S7RPT1_GLOTA|nr:uncharacterized protein GLOTRDRAFT_94274 [Gloeophyllum trabeum ATCC 11539]EPQ54894.1 hypothetical protein GLOTRDRAFT_94274 [Gloeophyllum trabeum ATCC 11539]